MKVLIATDGSEIAIDAARRTQDVLAPASEVILLCVYSDVPGDDAGGFEGSVETPEEMERDWEQLQADAHAALERTAEVLAAQGSVERRVDVGDAGATICAVAEREKADVIVVGSHGRGLLGRIVHLGSVSEYVMRHAPCPVLVVRAVQH
jgi:nucleotide-binding universal stress UspA family protein